MKKKKNADFARVLQQAKKHDNRWKKKRENGEVYIKRGREGTHASLTNASQSPEYTMPRRACTESECEGFFQIILTFSNRLSAYTSSAWRSTSVMVRTNPTPVVFRDETTMPASLDVKYGAFFRCWDAMSTPCFVCPIAASRSYVPKNNVSTPISKPKVSSRRTSSAYDMSPLTH